MQNEKNILHEIRSKDNFVSILLQKITFLRCILYNPMSTGFFCKYVKNISPNGEKFTAPDSNQELLCVSFIAKNNISEMHITQPHGNYH